jgi:type IV pilus assembly protein PilY1
MKSRTILWRTKSYIISLFLLFNFSAIAEDIELFISDSLKKEKKRPQVLIIFDNSGSMSTKERVKASYNPNINYPAVGGLNALSNRYIYYRKGNDESNDLPIADSPNELRRFLKDINSCKTATEILDVHGFYTAHIREYTFEGNSGRWLEIPDTNGSNIQLVDCETDVLSSQPQNANVKSDTGTITPLTNGYPVDGEGNKTSPQYHTNNASDSNVSWNGAKVTLYTDNYLRWYQSDIINKVRKARLDIAKESVISLISSSPYVDFGLQVFNNNSNGYNYSGGRVVFGIQELTSGTRNQLVNTIGRLTASTWTPLCETLYEASRYFSGKSVYYGDDYDVVPKRDRSIEAANKYVSPLNSCSDKVYVIIITDGEPSYDSDADGAILAIPEAGQTSMGSIYKVGNPKSYTTGYSYLPALAGWINTNDLNSSLDGKQTAETYTIGFGRDAQADAEALLMETASRGGGKYFYAQDTATLTGALTNVLANLEPSNDTLTSASVGSNNFDRTETLNSVYYAMFQPDRGPRWQGNLKKYKLVNGTQKGRLGKDAINDGGFFSSDATSFWSSDKDGGSVSEGGVAEMLRGLVTSRNIYSDLGANNALEELTITNAISSNAFGSKALLAAKLDVNNDDDTINEYLNWAMGINVDAVKLGDEPAAFMRPDVFGDPLHSKPVVINYGNGNIYIAVGTNQGALHMFKDNDSLNTVSESWAFMPKELFPNIKPLRENFTSSNKVYGIDGEITSHIVDLNGNGIVDGDDKVWLFFGLRRGGNSYYGINVTNPDSPEMMWHIEGGIGSFSEMGQTWSQPKIAYSKLNTSGNNASPVLIFGGGYDIKKDNEGIGGASGSDGVGKAIYMVDAESGSLIWSLAPSGSTTFSGAHSIPSSIAILDSDGDGFTDRLYTGDTGGDVWRVDMPGDQINKFSVFKLASLGGTSSNSVDRRFFNEPAIARAIITETVEVASSTPGGQSNVIKKDIPYDAILMGSGDRSNPLGTDTNDVFYMIKDKNIHTQEFSASSKLPIPSVITSSDLYDYTNNPFKNKDTLSDNDLETLSLAVSKKSGWYLNLTDSGEKSTSKALVISNVVYFTAYTPPILGLNSVSCNLPDGKGWLYAVDLSLGIRRFNWADNSPGSGDSDSIKIHIGDQFSDDPTIIVTKSEHGSSTTTKPTLELITNGKNFSTRNGFTTKRTYLYINEQ